MTSITIDVPGIPAPQGSKTRTKWGVREDNPATRPWRQAVAWEARAAYPGPPLTGPLVLTVLFYFPRPKSHYRTGRHADQLKDTAPDWCSTKPDADKLLRAIGDALTGVIAVDDSQFVYVAARKLYGTPGALIHITRPVEGAAAAA